MTSVGVKLSISPAEAMSRNTLRHAIGRTSPFIFRIANCLKTFTYSRTSPFAICWHVDISCQGQPLPKHFSSFSARNIDGPGADSSRRRRAFEMLGPVSRGARGISFIE